MKPVGWERRAGKHEPDRKEPALLLGRQTYHDQDITERDANEQILLILKIRGEPAEKALRPCGNKLACPGRIVCRQGRLGLAVIDEELVTGSVVGAVERFLQIDASGVVRRS